MQFSKNNEYREYFKERFGIGKEIEEYDFYEFAQSVWAYSGKDVPEGLRIEVLGIRALRTKKTYKPTTAFLRVIGKYATKNVITLEDEDAMRFLKGERIKGVCGDKKGYVVVKSDRDVLGCGLCSVELISQIPKKYRMEDTWL